MQETAVENPYGLGALIANGNIIARSILAILLIMSLLTWFIMITKFFDQRRTRLQAIAAEREFWSSSSLTDAISKLKGTSNPFRALAETGKQAYEYHETNKTRLSGAIGTSEWITESLQRTADTVISRMQSGLPVLASVGATAPFVGLLGTVIGIYHALDRHRRRRAGVHRQGGGPRRRGLDHDRHRSGGRGAGGAGIQHSSAPQQGCAGARQPLHARAARVSDRRREDGSRHGQAVPPPPSSPRRSRLAEVSRHGDQYRRRLKKPKRCRTSTSRPSWT